MVHRCIHFERFKMYLLSRDYSIKQSSAMIVNMHTFASTLLALEVVEAAVVDAVVTPLAEELPEVELEPVAAVELAPADGDEVAEEEAVELADLELLEAEVELALVVVDEVSLSRVKC